MSLMRDRIPVCPHGKQDSIDLNLVLALESLERRLGFELKFSSGYRCEACNEKAGGVKNSAHLRGKAVDVRVVSNVGRFIVVSSALSLGFNRIGVGPSIVHLDIDTDLPDLVMWLY